MTIIDDVFLYLGMLLNIINMFLYALSYKKNSRNLTYKLFSLYLLCELIINISAFILASYQEHNLFLTHYYFILQYIILSLFYKTLFKNPQKQMVTVVFIPVLTILAIQYAMQPELYFKFNTTEVFITSLPIVVYSMIHLYNSLNESPKYMYINAGVLIYITTSTLIFILGDYLSGNSSSSSSSSSSVDTIWFINKVLYVIYLALIFIEWWRNFRIIKNK
jgi:hypothetical protein